MISQSSKGSQSQAKALLNAYLSQLAVRPLQTKMATSGVLSFLQEVLASRLARLSQQPAEKAAARITHESIVSSKAWKMAIYGAFVSAPMGHLLVGTLQKTFAGKTSKLARFGQVLASNIFVAPIQAFVYLVSMCVINGLRDPQTILQSVKARYFSVLKISWVTSPLAILVAQTFIPPELWVPWFNLVTFSVGTYLNMRLKRLASAKA